MNNREQHSPSNIYNTFDNLPRIEIPVEPRQTPEEIAIESLQSILRFLREGDYTVDSMQITASPESLPEAHLTVEMDGCYLQSLVDNYSENGHE